MSILQVQYSCHGCGLRWAPVTVAHRKQGEDIIAWLAQVQQRVADDHLARSPGCREKKCDLRIPTEDGVAIGGQSSVATPRNNHTEN